MIERATRIVTGIVRPSTRSIYVGRAKRRLVGVMAPAPTEPCLVCGEHTAEIIRVMEPVDASAPDRPRRTCDMRLCSTCGHVGNPDNTRDYREYERLEDLAAAARVGTMEQEGREFHMANMATAILARDDLDVMIFGAGRSFDNHHIARLPSVRAVAVGDVMQLRDDAEFIDINLPAPRQFDIVVASEVVEHFLEPRPDFAKLLGYVKPDGLLVCSTNIYDGRGLGKHKYPFVPGHTSYYSPGSMARLAAASGFMVDFRVPSLATGYGGRRKRYVLFTGSPAVRDSISLYFAAHMYAPSESATADAELRVKRAAAMASAEH